MTQQIRYFLHSKECELEQKYQISSGILGVEIFISNVIFQCQNALIENKKIKLNDLHKWIRNYRNEFLHFRVTKKQAKSEDFVKLHKQIIINLSIINDKIPNYKPEY